MNRYWVVVATALALAACKTNPSGTSAVAPVSPSQGNVTSQEAKPAQATNDLASNAESVYFDFDQSVIKPQFSDVLRQEAEWMKSHGENSVTLVGNADERGSAEYNLALGSRRAAAVRRTLVALGVSQPRVKDVSVGKEKPKATCHEEKCWAENRRVDFVHN